MTPPRNGTWSRTPPQADEVPLRPDPWSRAGTRWYWFRGTVDGVYVSECVCAVGRTPTVFDGALVVYAPSLLGPSLVEHAIGEWCPVTEPREP